MRSTHIFHYTKKLREHEWEVLCRDFAPKNKIGSQRTLKFSIIELWQNENGKAFRSNRSFIYFKWYHQQIKKPINFKPMSCHRHLFIVLLRRFKIELWFRNASDTFIEKHILNSSIIHRQFVLQSRRTMHSKTLY